MAYWTISVLRLLHCTSPVLFGNWNWIVKLKLTKFFHCNWRGSTFVAVFDCVRHKLTFLADRREERRRIPRSRGEEQVDKEEILVSRQGHCGRLRWGGHDRPDWRSVYELRWDCRSAPTWTQSRRVFARVYWRHCFSSLPVHQTAVLVQFVEVFASKDWVCFQLVLPLFWHQLRFPETAQNFVPCQKQHSSIKCQLLQLRGGEWSPKY